MIKLWLPGVLLMLPLAVAGCDAGPYDPAAHWHVDSSTGSMLSGTDTGADTNGSVGGASFAGHSGEAHTSGH